MVNIMTTPNFCSLSSRQEYPIACWKYSFNYALKIQIQCVKNLNPQFSPQISSSSSISYLHEVLYPVNHGGYLILSSLIIHLQKTLKSCFMTLLCLDSALSSSFSPEPPWYSLHVMHLQFSLLLVLPLLYSYFTLLVMLWNYESDHVTKCFQAVFCMKLLVTANPILMIWFSLHH